MMDIKDIIKWFIPGVRIFGYKFTKMDIRFTFFLLLFLNCRPSFAAKLPSDSIVYSDKSIYNSNNTKKFIISENENLKASDQSFKFVNNYSSKEGTTVGRTFGRPFKKMIQAFIPLAFNLGMASTWAVVAALVGIKTLGVALVILKLLLLAGAAKIGALFAQKAHSAPAKWEPQKEIHLHIHSGQHEEDHAPTGPWSRESLASDSKHVDLVLNQYPGPQTISTPYGNYVRVEPGQPVPGVAHAVH